VDEETQNGDVSSRASAATGRGRVLEALLALARADGFSRISLSAEPE
jgi:hypothetical protein